MNTLRTSHSTFEPRRLMAIGLMSLTLAGCGGDGGSGPSASTETSTSPTGNEPSGGSGTGTPSNTTALDCVRDNYPCSFAEVSLPVVERSLTLSEDVAQQLQNGAPIAQVAAFLQSQSDIADVTVDGPVLGFRLNGGRPMIVDVTGDQELLPSAPPAATAATSSLAIETARKLRTVRTGLSSKITGDNKAQRRAIVLSPFRYEADFGNSGEVIAAELNTVRGYAGNVTYLATTNESAPQVTVDVLTQLQNYDVIHIDTHGGTLCKTDGGAVNGDKGKCDNGITDLLVQRFHGTAQDLQSIQHPGVIHYRGQTHQSIAVTADFFRHYYPQGLGDKLFILGACNTYRTDMAVAIAGSTGVFVSWDGYTDGTLVRNTGISLIDSLRSGLTVSEAFERMPPYSSENPEATGTLHHTLRAAGGDLRIRDLMTVRDNLTGELVSDSSGIEVMETPEDGENDRLDLEITVDGVTPERLANFNINLTIEDQVIGQINLAEQGVPVGDFSYRVTTPVPLSFDAQELQELNLDFWIPLPDQGEDHFVAAPRVNDRANPEVGREWVLGSRLTEAHHDSSTTITADVQFELDPDDDPEANYHYFYVRTGRVRVQRTYEDANNCLFLIDHTIDLPANADNNYLVFDTRANQMTVDGFGRAPNTYIEVTSSNCPVTATVNIGYSYFTAEDTVVSGDSAQGTYDDGAPNPTVIQWTLDKTM